MFQRESHSFNLTQKKPRWTFDMKEGDFVPDKRARWSSGLEPKKKSGMSRRGFLEILGGAGTLAAGSMIPKSVIKGLTDVLAYEKEPIKAAVYNLEKQKALDNAIAAVQRNLRNPLVLEALEGRGKDPLSLILGAVEIPILPEYLEGTSYDVSELLQRYPAQVETSHGQRTSIGNGIFWQDPGIQLTAGHVVSGDLSPDAESPAGVDVSTYRVDPFLSASSEQVVKNDPNLTNADIHGQLVSIVGFDPDTTSDKNGYKTYPGIAIKVTHGLARFLAGYPRPLMEKYQNSFMLILPPGEAKQNVSVVSTGRGKSTATLEPVRRAAGMSGSPMFVHLKNGYVFGGIFWSTVSFGNSSSYRNMDIGFVHGIDDVRRALK